MLSHPPSSIISRSLVATLRFILRWIPQHALPRGGGSVDLQAGTYCIKRRRDGCNTHWQVVLSSPKFSSPPSPNSYDSVSYQDPPQGKIRVFKKNNTIGKTRDGPSSSINRRPTLFESLGDPVVSSRRSTPNPEYRCVVLRVCAAPFKSKKDASRATRLKQNHFKICSSLSSPPSELDKS